MPSTDLYEILGVSRSASQDEVRKAYLKLAHKYHPDKTGGDKAAEDKLKEVNAAYDILKNSEKRAQYDRYGSTDAMGGGNPFSGGFSGFGGQGFGGGGQEAPFEDLFDMLFGQGKRRSGGGRPGAQPGNDLELRLTITLEDAAFGAKKTIRYGRMENCADCKGAGAAPGSKPETCSQCGGTGQVRAAHGFFSVTRPCPRCKGAGRVISKPCRKCSGAGQIKNNRELSVDVPAGVDTGSRLRITGEGEAGPMGGPNGDLFVVMQVQPHDIFQRDQQTLLVEVPVPLTTAALGGTIRVPTLKGEAELKIPIGAQSGTQLRMRGLGLPDIRGYRQGDLIVQIAIETPAKLNKKQKELLEEFEKLADKRTYPRQHQFAAKTSKKKKTR